MNEAQVKQVVDEMMDMLFSELERQEREVEQLMQEQNEENKDA